MGVSQSNLAKSDNVIPAWAMQVPFILTHYGYIRGARFSVTMEHVDGTSRVEAMADSLAEAFDKVGVARQRQKK